MNRDEYNVRIVGNLVQEPELVEDEEGNKVCYSKIATNPRAQKFDKDGNRIPDEERNRYRSFVSIIIPKTAAAEKFYEFMDERDRVWVEGEQKNKRVPQLFWSEKEQKYVTIDIDIDKDGRDIQTIMENQAIVRVHKFGKVRYTDGISSIEFVS